MLAARLRDALARPPLEPPLDGDLPELRARADVAAAVLIAITDRPEPGVILTVRREHMRTHAGQIAFPGGRLEPSDAGPREAAVREAVEEVGLDASGVEVLGTLPPMPVPVSNHLVTPVPAWWTRPSQVAAVDHAETVDVFRVAVADLLEPANRASVEHARWGRTVRTPAFTVDGVLVWGFTGIVLARMFDALGWAVPYDVHRIVQAR